MNNNITSVMPEFGVNYKAGYSFGTFRLDSENSYGIAWFTRWDNPGDILCSHVGFVSENGGSIESIMKEGVIESNLDKYFDDPHTHIFFRKPRRYTNEIGKAICDKAKELLGKPYDKDLIKAHALSGTYIGHLLSMMTDDELNQWLEERMNDPNAFICSEMCAWTMQQFPEFAGLGCLTKPACTINPVQYIADSEIWTPMRQYRG